MKRIKYLKFPKQRQRDGSLLLNCNLNEKKFQKISLAKHRYSKGHKYYLNVASNNLAYNYSKIKLLVTVKPLLNIITSGGI